MATHKDITVDQGGRYQLVIAVTGLVAGSLNGYSARMYVRKRQSDAGAVSVGVSSSIPADLSAYLSVDSVNNLVTLDIPDTVSTAFSWDRGVYDIEVFKVGSPTYRVLQGNILVDREVTR